MLVSKCDTNWDEALKSQGRSFPSLSALTDLPIIPQLCNEILSSEAIDIVNVDKGSFLYSGLKDLLSRQVIRLDIGRELIAGGVDRNLTKVCRVVVL